MRTLTVWAGTVNATKASQEMARRSAKVGMMNQDSMVKRLESKTLMPETRVKFLDYLEVLRVMEKM